MIRKTHHVPSLIMPAVHDRGAGIMGRKIKRVAYLGGTFGTKFFSQ